MNHMILGSCMLVCAILLIFIPTYERNNFKQLIPTRFRQVNLHPDRNLAHIEAFPTLLLSLMVSDWFLEVLSQQKSDIAIPVFCSFHISLVFITTIIKDSGLGREPSVIFECYQFNCLIFLFYISVCTYIGCFHRPYSVLNTYLCTLNTLHGMRGLDPI